MHDLCRSTLLVIALLCTAAAPATQPWVGVHTMAGGKTDLAKIAGCVPGLRKVGVNVLIVQVDYNFTFKSRPEMSGGEDDITPEAARAFGDLCRANGIRPIPMIDCLGHQSWAKHTGRLLTKHPELDETPGKFPENEGLYCRSWCISNPRTNEIVFLLIDELVDAFAADAFHIGMDEVFIIGSDDCPRCRGHNPAELFARQVKSLHDHLAARHVETFMWADRLIDARALGYSKWEASANGTAPAVDLVPRDIVMCDWHYEKQAEYKSVPFLLTKGFRVWPSGWHKLDAAEMLMDTSIALHDPRLVGYLSTMWGKVKNDALDTFAPTILAGKKFGTAP